MSAVVVEEHPVSTENVQKLKKHLVGGRGWLQEAAKIFNDRTLQKKSTGQSKDMGPAWRP